MPQEPKAAAAEPANSRAAAQASNTPATRGGLESETIRRSAGAGAAAPQAGGAATAPRATGGFETSRIVLALILVIGLALFLRWLSRRLFVVPGGGRSSRAIQVLSRAPLSPKQQLMLVQVGRRLIVVADSGGQMNPLCEITDPDEVAQLVGQVREEKEVVAKAFGNLFGRAKQRFDGEERIAATSAAASATSAMPTRGSELHADPDEDDAAVAEARADLSGLMQKVRFVTRQFKGS